MLIWESSYFAIEGAWKWSAVKQSSGLESFYEGFPGNPRRISREIPQNPLGNCGESQQYTFRIWGVGDLLHVWINWNIVVNVRNSLLGRNSLTLTDTQDGLDRACCSNCLSHERTPSRIRTGPWDCNSSAYSPRILRRASSGMSCGRSSTSTIS